MVRAVQLTAFGPDSVHARTDCVAVEAPLEVRLNGEPFAVIMRTPGDDEALALGFLLSESVIEGADEVAETASWPDDAALGNRINVVLTPDATNRATAALDGRRRVAMSSACGLCGRVTIDSLRREGAPVPIRWSVPAAILHALPSSLRATQQGFDETGGVHAAGLFGRDGALIDLSGGCRPPQRRGQGGRADAARRPAAARGHAARRQRPRVLRDRPEGTHRGRSRSSPPSRPLRASRSSARRSVASRWPASFGTGGSTCMRTRRESSSEAVLQGVLGSDRRPSSEAATLSRHPAHRVGEPR